MSFLSAIPSRIVSRSLWASGGRGLSSISSVSAFQVHHRRPLSSHSPSPNSHSPPSHFLHSTTPFSIPHSHFSMATKIDGKEVAQKLRDSLKEEVAKIREKPEHANFTPGLAIVQVGDRADSNVYIRHKLKAAEAIGVEAKHHKLSSDMSEADLLQFLDDLNANTQVHGVIVQLPLDTTQTVDTDAVIDRIVPEKDVDGLTRANAGRLARGELENTVIPCTPRGCLHLVESTGVSVAGKRVVVLGRSRIVGFPAAALFLWHHGTVTICHSKTKDLADVCRQADILIVAIGRTEMVKKDWIKPGAVVIDCGINVLKGGAANGKDKLLGDVDYGGACEVASFVTPVPGGVGPMTVAMLLKNTVDQAKKALL